MAKSSRSKWKKLHRRQKAKEESVNTLKRIKQLHKKLELTVKGGISAVPPQEPEKRFHFLNPELDPRVPNTRKDLNNNYRAELNHVHYDYTKPLKLAPPKTNLYGKSDSTAPHPMTQNFETLDADAPLGGHALTKVDVERMARRQNEKEAETALQSNEEGDILVANHAEENNSEGPEEFVFDMDDDAPRRAGTLSSKKLAVTLVKKAKKGSSAVVVRSGRSRGAAAAEEDVSNNCDVMAALQHPHSEGKKASKITSMQSMRKRMGVIVSAGGESKMKKVGRQGGVSSTRMVSSGGKAAKKPSGGKKIA